MVCRFELDEQVEDVGEVLINLVRQHHFAVDRIVYRLAKELLVIEANRESHQQDEFVLVCHQNGLIRKNLISLRMVLDVSHQILNVLNQKFDTQVFADRSGLLFGQYDLRAVFRVHRIDVEGKSTLDGLDDVGGECFATQFLLPVIGEEFEVDVIGYSFTNHIRFSFPAYSHVHETQRVSLKYKLQPLIV